MTLHEGRVPGPTLQDAETLVRSLVGVAGVRFVTSADGSLREIVVVPDDSANDRQICRNVTSALMARFGIEVGPGAISISPIGADTDSHSTQNGTASSNGGDSGTDHSPANGSRTSTHSGVARNADQDLNGQVRNGAAGANGGDRNGAASTASPNGGAQHATVEPHARGPVYMHAPVRPRLEIAELRHVDGLARCRVVVAAGSERFVGIADGLDTDISDIELAGRVTVDALRAARTPRDPIQFEGASTVDVGGRAHIVTCLSIWTGADFETIAGAEPVRSSTVEAAAQAVISSIAARLIA